MNSIETKNAIRKLYEEFFSQMKINRESGKVMNTQSRFTGLPFIGRNYCSSPIRVLFIALDVGKDECKDLDSFHSLEDREAIFPDGDLYFNAHIGGMYATALYILKDKLGWDAAWNSLWEQRESYKTAKAIRICYDYLPKDLMSYIAYDNRFHFVTINRENRTGGQDRKYLDSQIEGKLLMDEIKILAPNIIIFQGKDGIWNCHIEELREKYNVIVACHPSCWQRGADKLQYIVDIIGPQIGK